MLVLSSEESGFDPVSRGPCDVLIARPQYGRVQSPRAGAAAAVLMYGIVQRRRHA